MSAPAAVTGDVAGAVLDKARQGDPGAFEQLVRHYDPMLRALAYRLMGDRTAMDDVLQEAYVKAFRALPGFRADAALGTWLYRITYRTCLDALRAEGRRRTTPMDEAGPLADPAGDPARTVAQRADLARALDSLPPDQRAAVLLVDAEGLDYTAAAEVLGVAPGTIASRLSRARAALRIALDEGDPR
ncbi:MAG: RNA polymerase sigma factor [Acidimicrobiia bacterium]